MPDFALTTFLGLQPAQVLDPIAMADAALAGEAYPEALAAIADSAEALGDLALAQQLKSIGANTTLTHSLAWQDAQHWRVVVQHALSTHTPEKQLALAKQVFWRIEKLSHDFYRNVQSLAPNDLTGLKQLAYAFEREQKRLTHLIEIQTDKLSRLIGEIFSSARQLLTVTTSQAELAVLRFEIQGKSWAEALSAIGNPADFIYENKLVGNHGYQTTSIQRELGNHMVGWLRSRSPQESWEKEDWVLRYSLQSQPVKEPYTVLTTSPWPPDSQNDLVLQTFLELLGWKMTVKETENYLEVRISF